MRIKNYEIRVQAVDNGYVIQCGSDTPGTNKRQVALSDDDLKKTMHNMVDHMFDEPPVKEKAVVQPKVTPPGKPAIVPGGLK